ncbi:hypothetical protein MMC28_010558 [Mycoblastus sanguinarius]|nr:hypothetical protein [Mycoblastus sanguinarius]
MQLTYSAYGILKELTVKSVGEVAEELLEHDTPKSRYAKERVPFYFEAFKSLIKFEAASLKKVVLEGISVSVKARGPLAILLSKSKEIVELCLINVQLYHNSDIKDGLEQFVNIVKGYAARKKAGSIQVNLTDLRLYGFAGAFSADTSDIERWREGNTEDLVEELSASFGLLGCHCSDSDDDDDEDSDEDSDEDDDDDGDEDSDDADSLIND